MVLVQFFITQATNDLWHDLNINGPCSARLVNYSMNVPGNDFHLIQLRSDVFKTPYSSSLPNQTVVPSNGILLTTQPVNAFDQSHQDYHWNNVVIPGRVQWTVVGSGNFNEKAFSLLLTFDIEELP